jgi:hypothetical protein
MKNDDATEDDDVREPREIPYVKDALSFADELGITGPMRKRYFRLLHDTLFGGHDYGLLDGRTGNKTEYESIKEFFKSEMSLDK